MSIIIITNNSTGKNLGGVLMNSKIHNDDSVEITSFQNNSEWTKPSIYQSKEDEAILEITVPNDVSKDELQTLVETFERLYKNLSQQPLTTDLFDDSLN